MISHGARYGPEVEGCGIHHNPTPWSGPARSLRRPSGDVRAALAKHPLWDTIALPLQAQLYIRHCDLAKLPPERPRDFRTKLEMAAEQLRWLKPWVENDFEELWAVVDGGYAKKPFLKAAKAAGYTVVSRLRKDAALWSLPLPKPSSQPGPQATYGKERISLAGARPARNAAGNKWKGVQYGQRRPRRSRRSRRRGGLAGGSIRVVLVQEEGGWLPFFCVDPAATPEEMLEAMADRNAEEQTFKDVKEIWGAGQQQVRNLYSREGCFNLNLWMLHSLATDLGLEPGGKGVSGDRARQPLGQRTASAFASGPNVKRCNVKCCRRKSKRLLLRSADEGEISGTKRSGCSTSPAWPLLPA